MMGKLSFFSRVAVILFALLSAGGAAASDPRGDPGKAVRIAEFANSPAAQFLLVALDNAFSRLSGTLPSWETLPSETLDDMEEIRRASVAGAFDVIFTSDSETVRDLFDQGLLRSFFPAFSEEIVLVGPAIPGDFAEGGAKGVMERIFRESMPFFSLMANDWSLKAEHGLWQSAGIENPGINRNYVQSSRDDVTAMFQAGDEGAFLLVGESSYASYREAQRSSPALEKIAGTGMYRKVYVCLAKDSGFRKERAILASELAEWLQSDEAGKTIGSFDMAGTAPFRRHPLLGADNSGRAP
ncbi:MAG: hypothetical protein LBL73_04010 [Synergistaceae bacterium]|jgi:ABC-type tungstate transport system permease subunit|nr:hypothetical protein [Synergistaceae bacterium]